MLFGYARTSTARQVYSLEQQREELVAAGVPEANIFADQVSSVAEREQLNLVGRSFRRCDCGEVVEPCCAFSSSYG
jgi:DNA invertase Pin-like site-specific DNA recombinase